MSGKIWNEGRVVGFSAWELYCRQVAVTDPSITPADEKAWLASTLTYGASMLLWVAPDAVSGTHYRDFQFPSNSRLGAANTIMASCFTGEGGAVDVDGWATKIINYGNLIENDDTDSPEGSVSETGTIPVKDNGGLSAAVLAQMSDYLKIADGVIIQPGTWTVNESPLPEKTFAPTLTKRPRLRLSFTDAISTGFWLLLTGLTDRSIIFGEAALGDSTDSPNPENGDFIGPAVFPWAAKVLFSMPLSVVNRLSAATYTRKLPSTGTAVTITETPIIDMNACNPATYYSDAFTSAGVEIDVSEVTSAGGSVSTFAIYQLAGGVAPALFGANLTSGTTGVQKLAPIDIVAPGTVKIFPAAANAEELEIAADYNIGMYRDSDLVVYEINPAVSAVADRYVPLSDDITEDLASLHLYNTRYIWLYSSHSDNSDPTVEDLQSTKNMVCVRKLSGHVSDAFITDFCVSYADAVNACRDGHISDGMQMQKSYINQITEKYGAEVAAQRYVFFFEGIGNTVTGSSQNGMFYPVDLETKTIDCGVNFIPTMNFTYGLNFSGSSVTHDGTETAVPSLTTDLLGSYWDKAANWSATTASQALHDNTGWVFQDHPVLHHVVKICDLFFKSMAAVPKSPVEFSNNFVNWMSTFLVSSLLSSAQLEALGIHSDYGNVDFQTFLQYAATGRDLSQSLSTDFSTNTTPVVMHLYSASDIEEVADDNWSWTGRSIHVSAYARAYMSQSDFFKDAEVRIYEAVETSGGYEYGADVSSLYTDLLYHIWAAIGRSGLHKSTAISLVDKFGARLPTVGTDGEVPCNDLTWEHLLTALNQNRAINMLGSLKGLKTHLTDSGDDFLELNGLRLYISTTEPISNVPDGSVGIGWSSSIMKYTSGSWSAIS